MEPLQPRREVGRCTLGIIFDFGSWDEGDDGDGVVQILTDPAWVPTNSPAFVDIEHKLLFIIFFVRLGFPAK